MIYLASPYSHASPTVREQRYRDVLRLSAQLIFTNQLTVFSPIVYGHQMSVEFGVATDAETWAGFNTAMQRQCTAVYVACLDGWKDSRGIAAEIALAEQLAQPITYLDKFGGAL
jgi:hypothetical protein